MKITLTYAKLTDAINEFERLRTMPATMQILVGDRLHKFYNKNSVLFTSMADRIGALMDACVKKDSEGNYEKVEMANADGNPLKGWSFYDDQAQQRFNEGLKTILEQSVTIEI